MLVPKFWAEGREFRRYDKRNFTVRRWGWSNESQAAAKAHADQRTREAMINILAGDKLTRREPKTAYNGAEGVPIREEIVATHGETVITRNGYGALCLNTPNVAFADVDFDRPDGCLRFGVILGLCIVGLLVVTRFTKSGTLFVIGLIAAPLVAISINEVILDLRKRLRGNPVNAVRRRIMTYLEIHPNANCRLYQTPAGCRVMLMHSTFSPNDPAIAEFFESIDSDPIYVTMCQRQQCFRARVSPKPWRMKLSRPPYRGVWPCPPEKLPQRNAWLAEYESTARDFASCRFLESFGRAKVAPEAEAVRKLHDELCQATSNKPLA